MVNVGVRQQAANQRFVAIIAEEIAGLTAYVERGEQRIFVHTEVEDRFAGHGVATELIRSALEITRDQGRRIVAVCPFVAAYVAKHHDFDDIIDAVPPHHPGRNA